ncbi:MAG: Asp-tRNA(Asn)/Glu-tRNA(Gln) amidotransferase subunit GatC [Acidobacteriota bacterium]
MKIDSDEVTRIAALAHIELSPAEITSMAGELSSILEYIAQLEAIELAPPEPEPEMALSLPVLREDEVTPSLPTAAVAGNAPSFSNGFFVVPRIIGGE